MLPLWHRRVSRYIDSIILNGLIKCILNNTKLEKKKKKAPPTVFILFLENVVTHSISFVILL